MKKSYIFRNSMLDQAWHGSAVVTGANGYSDEGLVEILTECSGIKNWEVIEVDYKPGQPLVVTRHKGLLPMLYEEFPNLQNAQVKTHVQRMDVLGRHVFGVLPVHLASLTLSYTEIVLSIPAEKRGKELSEQEVRDMFVETQTYRVLRKEEWNELAGDYNYLANGNCLKLI